MNFLVTFDPPDICLTGAAVDNETVFGKHSEARETLQLAGINDLAARRKAYRTAIWRKPRDLKVEQVGEVTPVESIDDTFPMRTADLDRIEEAERHASAAPGLSAKARAARKPLPPVDLLRGAADDYGKEIPEWLRKQRNPA